MTVDAPPGDGSRRALAIGLVLAVTTYAFDGLSVAAAMPAIVDDLGGVSLYGAAFSAFMLANIVSLSVAGPLADRHGPRPVLATGLFAFAVGLVIGGLAPAMWVVVAGRAVQGIGAGTIGACAYVVIGRAWPDEGRARMFAVMSASWIVPSLIAPAAAGAVAQHLTWRLVFLGILPFPFIAAVLALPPLHALGPAAPELVGDGEVRRRVLVGLRLAAGALLVIVGLEGRVAALTVALVVAGLVIALPAFRRLMPKGTVVAAVGLPAIIATRLLLNWAFFGTDAFVPLLVTDVKGYSTLVAGLALTSASLSWSGAAWAQAKVHDAHAASTLVGLGTGLIGVGIAVVAVSLWAAVPVAVVFAGWAVAGIGMGFAFNTTSVAALARSATGGEGATSSSLQLADSLGVALATGLGGAVVAAGDRGGWRPAPTLAIVLAITGAAVIPCALAARRIDPPPATSTQ